jgi:hypothetical protein
MRMGRDADEIRKDEMVDGEQRAHREDEEDIEEHRADTPMLLPTHTQRERERERERERGREGESEHSPVRAWPCPPCRANVVVTREVCNERGVF